MCLPDPVLGPWRRGGLAARKGQVQKLVGKSSLTLAWGLGGSGCATAIAEGRVALSLLPAGQGLLVFPFRFTSSRSLMAAMNGQSSTATAISMTYMKR